MNKKNILKKTAALALGAALTASATGCSFVLTDNQKDMAQIIAKVDITKNMEQGDTLTTAIQSILKDLPSQISKRDLIATFLSYGYNQVQNYGYATVFNQIMDSLVEREIMVQYAVAHYLKKGAEDKSITAEKCTEYKNNAIKALNDKIANTENAEILLGIDLHVLKVLTGACNDKDLAKECRRVKSERNLADDLVQIKILPHLLFVKQVAYVSTVALVPAKAIHICGRMLHFPYKGSL